MDNSISINKTNPIYFRFPMQNNGNDFKLSSSENAMQLSGYNVGGAILARNNITFRNLATPIEVTDKYNKKIEGKDHLDLPNIHVYEYQDTNLQVIVNADENIDMLEGGELSAPKYSIIIENNNYDRHDLLKEKLLYFILNKKNADVINTSFCLSVFNLGRTNLLNDIQETNKKIFNLKFDNQDLIEAKNKLNEFLKSSDYIAENRKIKEMYNDSDLKTEEELRVEIENITKSDMQEYYEEYLKNSNVRAFLTTSKEYFEKNKTRILSQINQRINTKFLDSDSAIINKPDFIGNVAIINGTTLKMPTKAADVKDSMIENIAINILNSDKSFSKDYSLNKDSFSIPIELKNNSPIKYHCNICTVNLKNNVKDFTDFSDDLNKICNKSLASEIEQQKKEIKEKLKQTFTGERLDLIKHWELIAFSDEIFSVYEIIDSINEDDIKAYVEDYLII